MVKKNKMIKVLLFVGLAAVCIIGCGGTADNVETDEDVSVVDDTDNNIDDIDDNTDSNTDDTDDNAVLTEDAGADASAATGEIVEEESNLIDEAGESIEEETTSDRLRLSILGDSISTYEDYIPYGLSVYYSFGGELTDVSQTWWMRLLDDTGMELCSNDSSSGSTCVGDSLSVDEPKYGCSDYRVSLLTGEQGELPDVIIVYMGTNDFIMMTPMGDNDGTKPVEEGMIENFSDAYTMILDKLESKYPAAQIYCCTLAQVGDWGTDTPFVAMTNGFGFTSEDYSKQIEIIAANKGIPVIDLYHCGIEIDNLHETTLDGVHPIPAGMEYIEQAVLKGMGITSDE